MANTKASVERSGFSIDSLEPEFTVENDYRFQFIV
jgi:hypothetical protein